MLTIKDIALAAGVSPTTVSNVLHHHYKRVSPKTVEHIRQVIASMGYVPSMTARSLAGNVSRIIGVVSTLDPLGSGGFYMDPFHGELLSGIEKKLREHGYFLMIRTVENAQELHALLGSWNIDGLIMTGLFPQEIYDELHRQDTPVLLIDNLIHDEAMLHVRLEDKEGGYLATRHLLENGHERILFCCPSMEEDSVVAQRYQGYCDAMTEFGRSVYSGDVYQSSFSIEAGIALGEELAKRDDFTAIVATADILAAELCQGLTRGGKQVPEDVSIVGFDDSSMARLNHPPLTTIHQDAAKRGEKAVEILLQAIEAGLYAQPCVFPVSLVQRSSVKNVKEI
ncbi:MAG: LacI family DNA-binding transcriptional regulator [Clostridiales bacterium]|nr:LacI family DNA-binding transcriptional regulator [Clostridiales bacterium]